MKLLALSTLLALAAPQADAGDLGFRIGYHGKHVSISVNSHPPRRVQRHHCDQVWVPVHYETVRYKVWVPAHYKRVWVPARRVHHRHARLHRSGCRPIRLGPSGHWSQVYVPGHYEWRTRSVRRGGYYEFVCNQPLHKHPHRR